MPSLRAIDLTPASGLFTAAAIRIGEAPDAASRLSFSVSVSVQLVLMILGMCHFRLEGARRSKAY